MRLPGCGDDLKAGTFCNVRRACMFFWLSLLLYFVHSFAQLVSPDDHVHSNTSGKLRAQPGPTLVALGNSLVEPDVLRQSLKRQPAVRQSESLEFHS